MGMKGELGMKRITAVLVICGLALVFGAEAQAKPSGTSMKPGQHFGVNLEGLGQYGESRGIIFGDAMLQAQSFYKGADAAGNPTADQAPLIFSNCTPSFAGTYKFVCNGQPTLARSASYVVISNQAYNPATDTTTADLTLNAAAIAAAPQLEVMIGNVVAGKVKNVQVWRPGATIGQRFYAPYVKLMAPFDTIRFMGFLGTTGSTQKEWADRPLPTDRNYTTKGGCYEDAFALCKQTGKTPWICLPCQASPDYLKQFIALAKQKAGGPYDLEWSNEIWNSSFPQWGQAMEMAKADASLAYDGTGDPNILLYRWMGKQAVLAGKEAMAAYGVTDIRQCPVRPILAGQWGNPEVLKYALAYVAAQYGPPNQFIYAISIAPYATLSQAISQRIDAGDPTVTEQQIIADWAAAGINNASMTDPGMAAFMAQARQYNVHTHCYEFGWDKGQSQKNVAPKVATSKDPAIGPLLTKYVRNAWASGCEGLNWFTLTAPPDSNGDWGLTTDPYDLTQPKYKAAAAAAAATSH